MNDRQIDMLLYAAAELMGRPELDLYNSAPDDLKGSKRFIRRMRRLVKRARRSEALAEWRGVINAAKKIAIAVLIICTVGLGCTLSIEAVRKAVWEYIITMREHDYIVEYDWSEDELPMDIYEYKEPRAVDGYERYEISKSDSAYVIEYENESTLIVYQQMVAHGTTYISDKFKPRDNVELNGQIYNVFTWDPEDGVYSILRWNDGVCIYMLEANLTVEALLPIADSVK